MFFHNSALTVGMMKKGEISRTRTIPRPLNSRSMSTAIASPRMVEIPRTLPTRSNVFHSAGMNAGSVQKNS